MTDGVRALARGFKGALRGAAALSPCERGAHGVQQTEGDWLTYREAAERLNSTAEAVRYRAIRGRWPRMRGNDGRARIQLPDQPNPERTARANRERTPF
jgi:hypothetical protein